MHSNKTAIFHLLEFISIFINRNALIRLAFRSWCYPSFSHKSVITKNERLHNDAKNSNFDYYTFDIEYRCAQQYKEFSKTWRSRTTFSPRRDPSWGRSSLKSRYKPSTTAIYRQKTYRWRIRQLSCCDLALQSWCRFNPCLTWYSYSASLVRWVYQLVLTLLYLGSFTNLSPKKECKVCTQLYTIHYITYTHKSLTQMQSTGRRYTEKTSVS